MGCLFSILCTLLLCLICLKIVVEATNATRLESTLDVHFTFNESEVNVLYVIEDESKMFKFYIKNLPEEVIGDLSFQVENPDNLKHIIVTPEKININEGLVLGQLERSVGNTGVEGLLTLTGKLLGFCKIRFSLSNFNGSSIMESIPLEIKVKRGYHIVDKIFIHVIILMVVIAYINMGCAIDLEIIKETLRRPISPAIGLASQYFFMPMASYVIGYALFSEIPEMWLGIFLTGCSPGGGGSNMWTYLLGGSLDLSITMTFVSTVAAFLFLPVWVYALARTIFKDGYFSQLPYKNIGYLVAGLIIPLSVGLGIQKFFPRIAVILKSMLKPISVIFIIFVMTFGVYANLYIFSFFTWKVAVAGMCLPWLGFLFGGVMSLICRRRWHEVIAISIETGIQNTGLSIGILKLALRDYAPLEDITVVIPVAVATMTPIPLLVFFIIKQVQDFRKTSNHCEIELMNVENVHDSDSKTPLNMESVSKTILL